MVLLKMTLLFFPTPGCSGFFFLNPKFSDLQMLELFSTWVVFQDVTCLGRSVSCILAGTTPAYLSHPRPCTQRLQGTHSAVPQFSRLCAQHLTAVFVLEALTHMLGIAWTMQTACSVKKTNPTGATYVQDFHFQSTAVCSRAEVCVWI